MKEGKTILYEEGGLEISCLPGESKGYYIGFPKKIIRHLLTEKTFMNLVGMPRDDLEYKLVQIMPELFSDLEQNDISLDILYSALTAVYDSELASFINQE